MLHLCKYLSCTAALGSPVSVVKEVILVWYLWDFNSQQLLRWHGAPMTLLQHHQQARPCWDVISGLALALQPCCLQLCAGPSRESSHDLDGQSAMSLCQLSPGIPKDCRGAQFAAPPSTTSL